MGILVFVVSHAGLNVLQHQTSVGHSDTCDPFTNIV